jgi:putative ATPase
VTSLFDEGEGSPPSARSHAPLADRMRPRSLDEVVGQAHLVGPDGPLRRELAGGLLGSTIFWGPPGSGKTTLARLLAEATGAHFAAFSAVTSGVKEIRDVITDAVKLRRGTGRRTVLFVDEIHRFNRAQQDAFLPHIESGTIALLGATTENPSFEVNAALLSRARVMVLDRLTAADIRVLLDRALADAERGLGALHAHVGADALDDLAHTADGDARAALTALELAANATPLDGDGRRLVSREALAGAMQSKALLFDKSGEEHFNVISALHKSLRGSDPDACLYWIARLLEAGEDPLFVARRLVRAAAEDIGLADPSALTHAVAAFQAVERVGMPEGALFLAQVAVYLALAPKSNALLVAYGRAVEDAHASGSEPVPMHIRNAPTPLMRHLGYARDHVYPHEREGAFAPEVGYRPDVVQRNVYYAPTERGWEVTAAELVREFARRRRDAGNAATP